MLVDAVELDPVVVAAATEYMGLPHSRCDALLLSMSMMERLCLQVLLPLSPVHH